MGEERMWDGETGKRETWRLWDDVTLRKRMGKERLGEERRGDYGTM